MPEHAEDALRQILDDQIKRQQDARGNLVGVVLTLALVWGAWLLAQPWLDRLPEPFTGVLFLVLAAGSVLMVIGVLVRLDAAFLQPRRDQNRKQAVERAIAKIYAEQDVYHKPKRSVTHLLTAEDGELLEIVDDRDAQEQTLR